MFLFSCLTRCPTRTGGHPLTPGIRPGGTARRGVVTRLVQGSTGVVTSTRLGPGTGDTLLMRTGQAPAPPPPRPLAAPRPGPAPCQPPGSPASRRTLGSPRPPTCCLPASPRGRATATDIPFQRGSNMGLEVWGILQTRCKKFKETDHLLFQLRSLSSPPPGTTSTTTTSTGAGRQTSTASRRLCAPT